MAPAFPPVTPPDLGTVRVEDESGVVAVGRLSLTNDQDGAIDFAARGTLGLSPASTACGSRDGWSKWSCAS